MSVKVEVGQIWMDNDYRTHQHRFLRIEAVSETHAFCVRCNRESGEIVGSKTRPRTSRIRLDRFRFTSTGYVLHKEASK